MAARPLFIALASLSATLVVSLVAWATLEPTQSQDAATIVERLQRHVSGVTPLSDSTSASDLAGHYTAETPRLTRMGGGGLEGSDLYLFRDGSYVYTEWADIEPLTIHGQGRWSFLNRIVALAPRGVRGGRAEPCDERYAAFTFTESGGTTLRLMGTSCQLRSFEGYKDFAPSFEGTKDDWVFAFLDSSLEAVEHYSTAQESKRALKDVRGHARPEPLR
jgi:hypothetical protein